MNKKSGVRLLPLFFCARAEHKKTMSNLKR